MKATGDFVLLMDSNPIPGAGSPQYSRFFYGCFQKNEKNRRVMFRSGVLPFGRMAIRSTTH